MHNLTTNFILTLLPADPMVSCHQYHWSSVMCADWTLDTGVSTYVHMSRWLELNIVGDDISLFAESKDWHNNQKLKVEEDILMRLLCTLAPPE